MQYLYLACSRYAGSDGPYTDEQTRRIKTQTVLLSRRHRSDVCSGFARRARTGHWQDLAAEAGPSVGEMAGRVPLPALRIVRVSLRLLDSALRSHLGRRFAHCRYA